MIVLVQRKRRKTHLAASLNAEQAWGTLCGQDPIPMAACSFQTLDAAYGTISPDDTTICLYCARMIALVHILNRIDADRPRGRHLHIA